MTELNNKTRKELAMICALGYANQYNKDMEAAKRVFKGLLKGAGCVKPQTKNELIKYAERLINEGYARA